MTISTHLHKIKKFEVNLSNDIENSAFSILKGSEDDISYGN